MLLFNEGKGRGGAVSGAAAEGFTRTWWSGKRSLFNEGMVAVIFLIREAFLDHGIMATEEQRRTLSWSRSFALSWLSFSIRETFLDHGIRATSTEIGERGGAGGQGG